MRQAGIEPATSRSGGARSIPGATGAACGQSSAENETGRLAPARSRRPVQVRLRCAPVQPGVLHAGGLAGRELVVTGVERVVHVVVDRVDTGLGAGVLTLRAAERGDALRRR